MANISHRRRSRHVRHDRIRYSNDLLAFLAERQSTLTTTGTGGTFTADSVPEEFVLTVTAGNVDTANSTITFDGVTTAITNPSATPTAIADDFATQYNADGGGIWTAVGEGDGTVTLTATADEHRADIVNGDFVYNSGAVAEVFTMTVTAGNVDTADSTIAFDGVTVTVTNPSATPTAIADDFATQYNSDGGGTWVAVGNADGTVTFTASTAEARTDIVFGDFVYTANTADTTAVTFTAAAPSVDGVDGADTAAVTFSAASPTTQGKTSSEITFASHGLSVGDGPFLLTTTTTLPAGLSLATFYWVSAVADVNRITLSTSRNAPVAAVVSDAGTGTHTITKASSLPAMTEYLRQSGSTVLGDATDVDTL